MTPIKITAPIVSVPFKRAMTNGKRRYNPPEYTAFKETLAHFGKMAMQGRAPLQGAIKIDIEVHGKIIPTALTAGDWDNHAKAVSDALNGVCYLDDRQIIDGHVRLFKGEPKIVVTVEEL